MTRTRSRSGRGARTALLAACLLAGGWVEARAQSALPLKGAVDDDAVLVPQTAPGKLATTSLEIAPLAPEAPPRRLRAAADPYAPGGIGIGGLRLYPSLYLGGVYTSNVASSGSDPESDSGLQLKPAIRFESNWVRHSWTGNAAGSFIHYTENDDLDARTLDLSQRLRLDVRRGTTAEFTGAYALDQDGIGSSGVPATAKGLRTEHTLSATAALSHDFGPLAATLKAGSTARIFGDVELTGGGKEENKDRDYWEPSLSLRASYTESPALQPYAELSYTPRIHNITRDRSGLRRDSQGFGLAAGVAVTGDPVWSGDLGLTFLHRNYDDAALDTVNTFGLTGNLTWSPTELTRVVLSAGTSIDETTSATQGGNPVWTANATLTQDLRDNLALSTGGGVEVEDTGAALDVTYDASLGLSWKLNPVLSWTAGYDLTWLDAAAAGRSYTEHRVTAGFTLSR